MEHLDSDAFIFFSPKAADTGPFYWRGEARRPPNGILSTKKSPLESQSESESQFRSVRFASPVRRLCAAGAPAQFKVALGPLEVNAPRRGATAETKMRAIGANINRKENRNRRSDAMTSPRLALAAARPPAAGNDYSKNINAKSGKRTVF